MPWKGAWGHQAMAGFIDPWQEQDGWPQILPGQPLSLCLLSQKTSLGSSLQTVEGGSRGGDSLRCVGIMPCCTLEYPGSVYNFRAGLVPTLIKAEPLRLRPR